MANVTMTVPEELKCEMKKRKGTNWGMLARKAFEEAIQKEEMEGAAEQIDRLRVSSKTVGWSGGREIRKWRDAKMVQRDRGNAPDLGAQEFTYKRKQRDV
jgi:hypothetical protein